VGVVILASLVAVASVIKAGYMRGRRIVFRLVGIRKSKQLLLRRAELARVQMRPMLEKSIRDLVEAIQSKDRQRVDNALKRVDHALGTAGLKYNEEYLPVRAEIWASTKLLMGKIKAPKTGLNAVVADLASSKGQNSSGPRQRRITEFGAHVSQGSRRPPGQARGGVNSR
jgi:hypothetical protein